MFGKVTVDGVVVAEAQLMCKIADKVPLPVEPVEATV
jgi:hypothetical protein